MTAENIPTPSGLYIISGLIFIGVIQAAYYTITVPSYFVFGTILIPLFIYLGIGIIKRWKGARMILSIFLIILIFWSLFSLMAGLFIEEVKEMTSVQGSIQRIARLFLLPFVIYYLNSKKVKSYFKVAR